jgi:hypothetical protein
MTRIQIPAYTDQWMKGDRYGDLLHVTSYKPRAKNGAEDPYKKIAHVKLDKSGKTMRFMFDDCEVLP